MRNPETWTAVEISAALSGAGFINAISHETPGGGGTIDVNDEVTILVKRDGVFAGRVVPFNGRRSVRFWSNVGPAGVLKFCDRNVTKDGVLAGDRTKLEEAISHASGINIERYAKADRVRITDAITLLRAVTFEGA